eukprot:scaffold6557_cov129-Isochrysis_galbana.AAC.1
MPRTRTCQSRELLACRGRGMRYSSQEREHWESEANPHWTEARSRASGGCHVRRRYGTRRLFAPDRPTYDA